MIATQDQKPKTVNLPPALADVAFLDIRDLVVAVRMSASWIHDEVRAGRFPEPLRFGNRCTRWKVADVRNWLIQRAAVAPVAQTALAARTAKASHAAVAARASKRAALVTDSTVGA